MPSQRHISFSNLYRLDPDFFLSDDLEDDLDLDLRTLALGDLDLECISKLIFFFFLNWVSDWLLFKANSAIFQPYHGKNKLIVNEKMMMKTALY